MNSNLTSSDPFPAIKRRVLEYQEACLGQYGDSAKGVDWNSRESQYLAFSVIHSMGIRSDSSILDVGCGLAHFYDFLTETGYSGSYTGVDLSARAIEHAKKRLPHVNLLVGDILSDPIAALNQSYDFVIGSGIFTLKAETPAPVFETFIKALISKMFQLCKVGTVFNMLSSYVDYEEDRLYYADPTRYFRLAKSLTPHVILKHDYPAYFFTLALYKQANDYRRVSP